MEKEQGGAAPELLEYLFGFITEQRKQKMLQVLSRRTRYLSVVLEDIYQEHNASAVLRSCDAFGVQDVHIIENRNQYRLNPDVELGTAQWLSIRRYQASDLTGQANSLVQDQKDVHVQNSLRTFQGLKDRGYRIIATTPRPGSYSLSEVPISDGPIALAFGTELSGLTEAAIDFADCTLSIPMQGFVESFNISVSVALCLYDLSTRLRASGVSWALEEEEKRKILYQWIRRSLKRADEIERDYWENGGARS